MAAIHALDNVVSPICSIAHFGLIFFKIDFVVSVRRMEYSFSVSIFLSFIVISFNENPFPSLIVVNFVSILLIIAFYFFTSIFFTLM